MSASIGLAFRRHIRCEHTNGGRHAIGRHGEIRLTFLTVMPAPYQRELFSALVGSGQFDIKIFYYVNTARDRQWQIESLAEFETILPGMTLPFLGNSAHFNPGMFGAVNQRASSLFVVSDYSAPTAQAAMRYLSFRNIPWVYWGEIPGLNDRGRIGTFIRGCLQDPIKRAAGIAAIGSQAANSYSAKFPHLPVFNIPYFCDLARQREAATRNGPLKRGPSVDVLFSGQLITRKGVDVLLRGFERAESVFPQLRLLLIGDGPERARFESAVPQHLRPRVVFLGFRRPECLPDIFATADLFVLPSRHDGWGVVVNEALGSGLPIIATDKVGAAHDLVQHGVNGFIVPAEDPIALGDAIAKLAGSPSMRRSFARASRQISKNWDLDCAVSRWADLCKALLDRR